MKYNLEELKALYKLFIKKYDADWYNELHVKSFFKWIALREDK